jgi:hypothetical protein
MGELKSLDVPDPRDSVIEALESVLAQARDGELSSVGIAIVKRDGSTSTTWSNVPLRAMLIGAAFQLAHDLADRRRK